MHASGYAIKLQLHCIACQSLSFLDVPLDVPLKLTKLNNATPTCFNELHSLNMTLWRQ